MYIFYNYHIIIKFTTKYMIRLYNIYMHCGAGGFVVCGCHCRHRYHRRCGCGHGFTDLISSFPLGLSRALASPTPKLSLLGSIKDHVKMLLLTRGRENDHAWQNSLHTQQTWQNEVIYCYVTIVPVGWTWHRWKNKWKKTIKKNIVH